MSWGVALRNAVGLGISGIPSVSTSALPSPTVSFDFTKGILDPLITFTRASSATYFDSSGVLQTATTNTPRFDYNPSTLAALGLLIEEQRTNSLRNSTMQGVVAGTPGTGPTNWVMPGSINGLTQQIIGTGIENGVAYIDIKYSGTTTASSSHTISFESANQIAALSGQTWTRSAWFKIVNGSTTNITALNFSLQGRNAANTAFTETYAINISPSLTGVLTRIDAISSLGDINTAFARSQVQFVYNTGLAINITIRIGLPQLEQGGFVTSVIPTSTTAVTRFADVANITGTNFSSWFNAAQGTLLVKAQQNTLFAFSKAAIGLTDGTNTNRFNLYRQSTGLIYAFSNPGASTSIGPSAVANTEWKGAIAYDSSPASYAAKGAIQSGLSYTVLPSSFTELSIGNSYTGGNEYFNGYIQSLSYYAKRLNNSKLQIITT